MLKSNLVYRLISLFQKPSVRVAILMSGKGSNAEVILQQRYRYPNLNFVCIVTDQINSNAEKIAQRFQVDYKYLQILNNQDFNKIIYYLSSCKIDLIIYAGFMKIVPDLFLNNFPGINIHPSDLTICNNINQPKYVGMNAIKNAVDNNENYLASTVHVVDQKIDCGQPIAVSKHLILTEELKKLSSNDLHEHIKIHCEHSAYPEIIHRLSCGKITFEQMPIQLSLCDYFIEDIQHKIKSLDPLESMWLAQKRCGDVGFDFANLDLVFMKVKEEFEELARVYPEREHHREELELEIGDCFFSLVNLCRHLKINMNSLLAKNTDKFVQRCEFIENILKKRNVFWNEVSLKEIYQLWGQAKQQLSN